MQCINHINHLLTCYLIASSSYFYCYFSWKIVVFQVNPKFESYASHRFHQCFILCFYLSHLSINSINICRLLSEDSIQCGNWYMNNVRIMSNISHCETNRLIARDQIKGGMCDVVLSDINTESVILDCNICNMPVEYHVIMYIKYIWYISKKSWHHKGCFLPLNSPLFSLVVKSHCHSLISHLTQFCVFCMYCGTCSRPEYSWYNCFWMLSNRQSMNYVTRLSL